MARPRYKLKLHVPYYIPNFQLYRPECVSLASLACQLLLEKWFPLHGDRAQSLKVFNVRMLDLKNKIEMRKRRQNKKNKTLYQGHIQFSVIVALSWMFPSNLHAHMSIGGN